MVTRKDLIAIGISALALVSSLAVPWWQRRERHDLWAAIASAEIRNDTLIVGYFFVNRGTRTEVVARTDLILGTAPGRGATYVTRVASGPASVKPDEAVGGLATAPLVDAAYALTSITAQKPIRRVNIALQVAAVPRAGALPARGTELPIGYFVIDSGTPRASTGLFGAKKSVAELWRLTRLLP